jgi:putative spermidine/putrescine transport system ATP-binding protein
LRPEAVSLVPAGGAGWPGRVVSRHYGGNLVDYRVALSDGTVIHAQTFPTTQVEPGAEVGVHADAARLWPLED